MHINSNYDSGNIEIVSTQSPSDLRLAIHRDPYCDTDAAAHAQWFNFRLAGVADTPLTLRITNAGQCSYPDGWSGYAACASYDLEHWFRCAHQPPTCCVRYCVGCVVLVMWREWGGGF